MSSSGRFRGAKPKRNCSKKRKKLPAPGLETARRRVLSQLFNERTSRTMPKDLGGTELAGQYRLVVKPSHRKKANVRMKPSQNGQREQTQRSTTVNKHRSAIGRRVVEHRMKRNGKGIAQNRRFVTNSVGNDQTLSRVGGK